MSESLKEAVTLEYGRELKVFPLLAVAIMLVMMLSVLVFINPDPEGYPEGAWMFLVSILIFIVLPWLLFIEFYGTRAILDGEGIRTESLWRGAKYMTWREVEKAYYSSFSQLIVVKGERVKIRIHPWMSNIHRLLTTLNEMIPADRIHKNLEVMVRHLRLELNHLNLQEKRP